ncbi:hypothetical protein AAJP47_02005 [Psychrobacter sp. B38]|uniref:hypothetical protein n=1 Tax=Psychrobacter sp. B38 TaxID=3143538 RepID=UPI00320DD632
MLENTPPNDEEAVPVVNPAEPQNSNSKASNSKASNSKDSYEGRKHKPDIDGPQQASEETDEVYVDPRKEEDLPAGGKNVADLNAYDLSQNANK